MKLLLKKYWVVAVIGTLAMIGVLSKLTKQKPQDIAGPVDPAAPDFLVYDLENRPIRLSDYKGKVVLLDFWATWCPPCREEIPHFKSFHKRYSQNGLVVLGISLDEDGQDKVRSFVHENEISYPVAMSNSKIFNDFGGIKAIPTTFIIDREGKIAGKLVGYHDPEEFESLIKNLLGI